MLVTQTMKQLLHSLLNLQVKLSTFCLTISTMLMSGLAQAEYALNFPRPVTQVGRDIYTLHMTIFIICVVIFVLVFGVMFYSIFKHRKSKNYEPAHFSHSTKVEIVWTIIPFIILVVMAVPATIVLIDMEDTTKSDLTIKITGYQWKWGYEYLDSDISFFATLTTPREQIDQFNADTAQPLGENYLLETDKHLIVPSGRKVRALITANDVIHAWWIPAFGTKKDAIPGYINELWFNVDVGEEGIYRGQCAELCGKDHAYMPIVVEVVTAEKFDNWVASGGMSFDPQAIVEAPQQTSLEETASENEQPQANTVTETVVANVAPVAQAVSEQVTSEQVTLPQIIEPAAVEVSEPVTAVEDSPIIEDSPTVEDSQASAAEVTESAWSKDALMSKGADVYKNCIACHGADGKGIPGVFPAIAGSEVVNGDISAQLDLVMFGKAGTAMVAFANQLSDEEIASVITYQRNSFGNDVGDFVSPADVKAKRQ